MLNYYVMCSVCQRGNGEQLDSVTICYTSLVFYLLNYVCIMKEKGAGEPQQRTNKITTTQSNKQKKTKQSKVNRNQSRDTKRGRFIQWYNCENRFLGVFFPRKYFVLYIVILSHQILLSAVLYNIIIVSAFYSMNFDVQKLIISFYSMILSTLIRRIAVQ